MRVEGVSTSSVVPLAERQKSGVSHNLSSKVNEKERVNEIDMIKAIESRLKFSIHEKTKEIMVRIIDNNTDKVIREIPPEKILDLVAKLWELAGIIVDEKA